MKKTVQVSIFNHKFNVKSDSSEKHVQKIADFVNKKVFQIQEKTHSVSSLNVALLAALNIADDYFKIKGVNKDVSSEAKAKVKEIINFIDRCLEGE